MKTRTVAAGGIVGLLLIAGGLLFNGFGLGGGGGDGEGTGDGSTPDEVRASMEEDPPLRPAEVDPAPPVVEVLIDGDGYLLEQPGQTPEWRPATLDEIVLRAKDAEGNTLGVRVRIRRRGSALPDAEEALTQGLIQAGLSPTEFVMSDEIVR
ncbi:MAG: hypothetical protein KY476_10500 [Planctomycetes bacterium]|nr:hypothetical protein [Planctomycetota bacterium]